MLTPGVKYGMAGEVIPYLLECGTSLISVKGKVEDIVEFVDGIEDSKQAVEAIKKGGMPINVYSGNKVPFAIGVLPSEDGEEYLGIIAKGKDKSIECNRRFSYSFSIDYDHMVARAKKDGLI